MAETRTEEQDVIVRGREMPETTPAADPAFNPADPVTRKTPIDNPPDGKKDTIQVFYTPGPGDPKHSEIFGKRVKAGEAVEVPAKFAAKVAGNPYLSTENKEYVGPEVDEPEDDEEITFEEHVARERSKEYLEGRTQFANSPPGEADRVARAQQAAAELKAAVNDPDADPDKPRRGRPPKAK